MFQFCADPKSLEGLAWTACYLTSGKHLLFYQSFLTVMVLLLLAAPTALAMGFGGAVAARSGVAPLRWLGKTYITMIRGIPDIIFFLFFVIALDQGVEWLLHQVRCPDWDRPIRDGLEFAVCPAAKVPPATAPTWVHKLWGFGLAVITFGIVFGAFAANVIHGAMQAVPRAQLETAAAYGMSPRQAFRRVLLPQMWLYALPGLSNLWLLLIKATPLLYLMGVEDVVYWARDLGGAKTQAFSSYPHPDWRLYYFLFLLVFYLALTWVSQQFLGRLTQRLTRGQATMGGEALRREATA